MALRNTLDLTSDVPNPEEEIKKLIHENQFVVFVVIGTKKECKTLIKWADLYANSSPQGVKRKVIWLKNHLLLKDNCLELLKTSDNF